ncbi:DUF4192 domain-containing protein [Sphaerisporangium sp. NPDC049003]|uniref:DUF4192 domain-containing protein n=1 Tax=Sphaerisporangium sp. NPDC049003 TaxID=3364517 RepID=UPI003719CBD4
MTEPIRLSSPTDVVAVVPYMLGFHPALSMVVLMLQPNSKTVLGAIRFDLPEQGVPSMAQQLACMLTRNDVTHVMLSGYGPGSRVTPVMDIVRQTLPGHGIEVLEALRVEDGRCWSYVCTDPACCPPEGLPVDTTSRVAANAVVAGLVALPDRATVEAALAPVGGARRAAMRKATLEAHDRARALLASTTSTGAFWYAEGLSRVREALKQVDQDGELSDEQVAWLGILLTIIPVRDGAQIFPDYSDETQLRLWSEITRRVEQAYVPAPACLVAVTALTTGDGVLARIAAERALSADPEYRFALLLLQALSIGLPPSIVTEFRTPEMARNIAATVTDNPDVVRPILRDIAPEGR